MLDSITYKNIMDDLRERSFKESTVGILIAHPISKTVKSILNKL